MAETKADTNTQTRYLFVNGNGDMAQANNLRDAAQQGFKVISMVCNESGRVNGQQIVVLLQKN